MKQISDTNLHEWWTANTAQFKKFCESQGYTKTTYVNNILELTKDTSFTPDVRKRLHRTQLTFEHKLDINDVA